jgi:hypothetical protein
LKSTLGGIAYRFAQLRDRHSGRSLTPLVEALAIPAYAHTWRKPWSRALGLRCTCRIVERGAKWSGLGACR